LLTKTRQIIDIRIC